MKVDRKQIASMLSNVLGRDVSTDVVRRNADAWGINHKSIRMDVNKRIILYDGAKVVTALKKAKILDAETAVTAASIFAG